MKAAGRLSGACHRTMTHSQAAVDGRLHCAIRGIIHSFSSQPLQRLSLLLPALITLARFYLHTATASSVSVSPAASVAASLSSGLSSRFARSVRFFAVRCVLQASCCLLVASHRPLQAVLSPCRPLSTSRLSSLSSCSSPSPPPLPASRRPVPTWPTSPPASGRSTAPTPECSTRWARPP